MPLPPPSSPGPPKRPSTRWADRKKRENACGLRRVTPARPARIPFMSHTTQCAECVMEALGTAQAILQRVMGRQTDPVQLWVAVGHINTAIHILLDTPSQQSDILVSKLVTTKNTILRTPSTLPEFDNLMAELSAVLTGVDTDAEPASAKPKERRNARQTERPRSRRSHPRGA